MFREKYIFNCLKLSLYWLDILYNNNYILQVYIITFDTANVECGFHDIEHFFTWSAQKRKKKVETWKANYSKYRGASLFTEIPNKIYWHENYNPTLQMLLFSRVDSKINTRKRYRKCQTKFCLLIISRICTSQKISRSFVEEYATTLWFSSKNRNTGSFSSSFFLFFVFVFFFLAISFWHGKSRKLILWWFLSYNVFWPNTSMTKTLKKSTYRQIKWCLPD